MTAYINDILIYSSTLSEHQKHVQIILKQLQEISLQCNIKKYKFHVIKIIYLDLIIFYNNIKINSIKIKIIIN